MIQFVTSPTDYATVEDMMNYVNNFANLSDISNHGDIGGDYSVQKEYEVLMNIAGKINMDYTISPGRYSNLKSYGKYAKLKNFTKRILVQLFGWYLRDLAMQQTQFNSHIAKFVNQELIVIKLMNQELMRKQEAFASEES